MSDTLLLTIPGAADEDGADYDLASGRQLEAKLPTEDATRAAFEAERTKARAAERERIRLELLGEAAKVYPASAPLPHTPPEWAAVAVSDALRDFARRLESKP